MVRRMTSALLATVLAFSAVPPEQARGACDPNRPDDNKQRFIGSWISASSGNRYNGIKSRIEQQTQYLESSPTEAWIAVYPSAGVVGHFRAGIRYRSTGAVWFAEYRDTKGDYRFAMVGSLQESTNTFELKQDRVEINGFLYSEVIVIVNGRRVYDDFYSIYLGSGVWEGTRAFAYGMTTSLGSQVLGVPTNPYQWTSLQYRRNGAYYSWPSTAAKRNDFGDIAKLTLSSGSQAVVDTWC
jgi:hypothetical protein